MTLPLCGVTPLPDRLRGTPADRTAVFPSRGSGASPVGARRSARRPMSSTSSIAHLLGRGGLGRTARARRSAGGRTGRRARRYALAFTASPPGRPRPASGRPRPPGVGRWALGATPARPAGRSGELVGADGGRPRAEAGPRHGRPGTGDCRRPHVRPRGSVGANLILERRADLGLPRRAGGLWPPTRDQAPPEDVAPTSSTTRSACRGTTGTPGARDGGRRRHRVRPTGGGRRQRPLGSRIGANVAVGPGGRQRRLRHRAPRRDPAVRGHGRLVGVVHPTDFRSLDAAACDQRPGRRSPPISRWPLLPSPCSEGRPSRMGGPAAVSGSLSLPVGHQTVAFPRPRRVCMLLYEAYQAERDLTAPLRAAAGFTSWALGELPAPVAENPLLRGLSAVSELVSRAALTHVRPSFGIATVDMGGGSGGGGHRGARRDHPLRVAPPLRQGDRRPAAPSPAGRRPGRALLHPPARTTVRPCSPTTTSTSPTGTTPGTSPPPRPRSAWTTTSRT